MTATTYTWQVVQDGSTEPISPALASVVEGERQNLVTCREMVYDPATQVPILAHDHDGLNSSAIYPPSPNLITYCKFNSAQDLASMRAGASGVTFGSDSRENAGGAFDAAGDYLAVYVAANSANRSNFGTTAKIAGSVFARNAIPNTSGELRFGLCDGVANAAAGTFLAGCRASILYSHLDASWRRFWGVMTIPGATTVDLLMNMRVQTTFTNEVRLDAPAANLGPCLTWWWQSTLESYGANSTNELIDISKNLPIFDGDVSMRRATKLAVV